MLDPPWSLPTRVVAVGSGASKDKANLRLKWYGLCETDTTHALIYFAWRGILNVPLWDKARVRGTAQPPLLHTQISLFKWLDNSDENQKLHLPVVGQVWPNYLDEDF